MIGEVSIFLKSKRNNSQSRTSISAKDKKAISSPPLTVVKNAANAPMTPIEVSNLSFSSMNSLSGLFFSGDGFGFFSVSDIALHYSD